METKNKGITLIALIITIIVLLILAGITIATLTGNHGILTQVDNAKASTIKSKVEEEIGLAVQSANLKIRTRKAQDNSWNAVTEGILPTTAIAKTETSDITNEGANGTVLVTLLADLQKKGYYVAVTAVEGEGTGATRQITITYEGDDYKKATKNPDATITKTLDVSQNKIIYAACSHVWNEEIITEASCTTAGSKKQTCTNCGETRTVEIPAGHNFVDGVCTRCSARFSGNLTELGITWAILEDIAKQVSQDASIRAETTEVASDIVTSVTKTVGDKTYTISLGNWMPVEYGDNSSKITKKARIIGFKHDVLASKSAYGGNDTYAGISFEFVNTLEQDAQMNSTRTNLEGWEGCELRVKLLPTNMQTKAIGGTAGTGEYYAKLPNELTQKIKTVKKKWNPGNQNTAGLSKETEDKLWLLSYTEVWGGHVGSNCDPEGVRYGNYTKGASRVKYFGATLTSPSYWWLRSPYYELSSDFYGVYSDGGKYSDYASISIGVAPGFSI